jgi:hypothetical protein
MYTGLLDKNVSPFKIFFKESYNEVQIKGNHEGRWAYSKMAERKSGG